MPVQEEAPEVDRRHDGSESLLVKVFLGYQAGHWHAIAGDYTVLGQGDTPEQAVLRMSEMLGDYFSEVHRDGGSLADAHRPISFRWRLELLAREMLGRVQRLVHRSRPSRDVTVFFPHAPSVC